MGLRGSIINPYRFYGDKRAFNGKQKCCRSSRERWSRRIQQLSRGDAELALKK
jgi:hypothetical protein